MTPGEGFRDVTLYDVTPLMKIMSKVGEDQKKKRLRRKLSGFRSESEDQKKRSSPEIECVFGPNK